MSGYGPIWLYCMHERCGLTWDMQSEEQPMCPLGRDVFPHYEDCEPWITLNKGVWLHERDRIAAEQGELFDVGQMCAIPPAELEDGVESG